MFWFFSGQWLLQDKSPLRGYVVTDISTELYVYSRTKQNHEDLKYVLNVHTDCQQSHESPLSLSMSVFITLLHVATPTGKNANKQNGLKDLTSDMSSISTHIFFVGKSSLLGMKTKIFIV